MNGTAPPRPPFSPARTTATTVPINAGNNKAVATAAKSPQQSATVNVQKQAQSPPAVAGVKRPLENRDAVEGQPEAKKVAVDGAIAGGESRGG